MHWRKGYRELESYKTLEDSYAHCERIWNKYYGRLPDLKLANKWTGNDHPHKWLDNFYFYYNKF